MNTLEAINERIENTQRLIKLKNDRLQARKEQAAKFGIMMADPSITNEIKEIEQELETLQEELEQLKREKASLSAPLVYMHTFGTPDSSLPPDTYSLEWSAEFDREVSPRRISNPEVWENKLLPQLKDLREEKIKRKGLIRLQGTIALTAGFAFGCYFSRVGQYQLEVKQGEAQWRSDLALEAADPGFKEKRVSGVPGANDIAVLVNALKNQDSDDLIDDVMGYLNRQGGVQKLLLLEADGVTRHKKLLEGWQAAVLARNSLAVLRKFARSHTEATLHIFLATPAGLAVFLGHQWNAIGINAQLHEFAGGADKYMPSCRLSLA
jgi:hypothetical protein